MVEEVRRLKTDDEVRASLELSRRVFDEFVGPDYSREGRNTFHKVTEPDENIAKWRSGEYAFYGAFDGENLIGTVASREKGAHIMLLFVDKDHHRNGIARRLVNALMADAPAKKLTVNASPYAVKAYECMGFERLEDRVTKDGITFIPMEYKV